MYMQNRENRRQQYSENRSAHVATIGALVLALGLERYWHWGIGYCPIFSSIGLYWVLGNTFIGCHTQYQYCLDTLMPVASR